MEKNALTPKVEIPFYDWFEFKRNRPNTNDNKLADDFYFEFAKVHDFFGKMFLHYNELEIKTILIMQKSYLENLIIDFRKVFTNKIREIEWNYFDDLCLLEIDKIKMELKKKRKEESELQNLVNDIKNNAIATTINDIDLKPIVESEKRKIYQTLKDTIEIFRKKKTNESDIKELANEWIDKGDILNQKLQEVCLLINETSDENIQQLSSASSLYDLVNSGFGGLESLKFELEEKRKVAPNWNIAKNLWIKELCRKVENMYVDERFAYEQITKGEDVYLSELFVNNYLTSNSVLTHNDYVLMAEKDPCLAGRLYFADFDSRELSKDDLYTILSRLEYGVALAIFLPKLQNGDYEKGEPVNPITIELAPIVLNKPIKLKWNGSKSQMYYVLRQLKKNELLTNSYEDLGLFLLQNIKEFQGANLGTVINELQKTKYDTIPKNKRPDFSSINEIKED